MTKDIVNSFLFFTELVSSILMSKDIHTYIIGLNRFLLMTVVNRALMKFELSCFEEL